LAEEKRLAEHGVDHFMRQVIESIEESAEEPEGAASVLVLSGALPADVVVTLRERFGEAFIILRAAEGEGVATAVSPSTTTTPPADLTFNMAASQARLDEQIRQDLLPFLPSVAK
jgi:hypothetical protein